MILGLTGGIATGKSLVTEEFRRLGAEVVSADQLAREAVQPGSETLQRLQARFGPQILQIDGALDRKALASLIFADAHARGDLNRITHPVIARLATRKLRQAAATAAPLIVYEAPLLFEAAAEHRVDAVAVVTAPPEEQLARLMSRDGLSEEEARQRMAAQMPPAEKIDRADYVIDNSGSVAETRRQVRDLFARLTASSPPDPEENPARG